MTLSESGKRVSVTRHLCLQFSHLGPVGFILQYLESFLHTSHFLLLLTKFTLSESGSCVFGDGFSSACSYVDTYICLLTYIKDLWVPHCDRSRLLPSENRILVTENVGCQIKQIVVNATNITNIYCIAFSFSRAPNHLGIDCRTALPTWSPISLSLLQAPHFCTETNA